MSPRPYQLGKRQDQINESRQRVIDAARSLLAEATTYSSFTVEAVAKKADVARATVYYQFDSKTGLLEALCDALAQEGHIANLASAFMLPDPKEALSVFIACFGRFWEADRRVMRRLRSLAALDPEVGHVIAARDERRRTGLAVLVDRLNRDKLLTCDVDEAIRVLFTLTSFETFDTLAKPEEELSDVSKSILAMARVVWLA